MTKNILINSPTIEKASSLRWEHSTSSSRKDLLKEEFHTPGVTRPRHSDCACVYGHAWEVSNPVYVV